MPTTLKLNLSKVNFLVECNMTRFSKNFLRGSSESGNKVSLLAYGNYDIGLFLPSWDQRCVSILDVKDIYFTDAIIVFFKNKDEHGFRKKHDKKIKNFLKEHSKRLHEIEGDSKDIKYLEKEITSKIYEIFQKKDAPLTFFYDLSTSPRFYALTVFAFVAQKGLFKKINFFYAEGDYPEKKDSKSGFSNAFSKGSWKTVEIPNIYGRRRPNLRTMILVSVGFEGNKTIQLVESEEPDSVSVLFPDPGYDEKYKEVTYKFNEKLFSQYKIDNKHIFKVHAGDAIGVWEKLEKTTFDKPDTQNIIYICCGSKPHALGMCLKAVSSNYPVIKYRVPDEHPFIDVKPNGMYWIYSIEDLSVP